MPGVALPGLVNAHSHAFHRLLRGRTHSLGGDFWLWRERMYEVASTLTPERYEELATAVYVEMALAGITAVGEFHYLHHQPGGRPYDDPNEMGHALIRAARKAGIRITLLDAGYFRGGFDDRPLDPVQTRFSDGDAESWLSRVNELDAAYSDDHDVVIGLAPHSVRAVPEAGLAAVAEHHVPGTTPLHIHVSEQPAENEECVEATGLTPIGLLERIGLLGPDTTLVHATHLTLLDIETIARSGSRVCYCATTERDLADGIGPAHALADAGVALCVGTDSHAVIDVIEEARGIELHSRLSTGRRGLFSPEDLLASATASGAASLGIRPQRQDNGLAEDRTYIDLASPRMAGIDPDSPLAGVIFAASAADVTDVFVAGQHIVEDGAHPLWDEARAVLDGWSAPS